ncbi:hypothetical protein PsorP6_009057 [Peronosclerospora sorghi]|uniref:Uncharacterized protein n=1 Tax=Peronosclerospora sorghi TaxID=230839 RepID=A0ACC0VZL6_9STRA|nr:hypothetical protein PsorP6_009057 [Peronosclerospora sorghi]
MSRSQQHTDPMEETHTHARATRFSSCSVALPSRLQVPAFKRKGVCYYRDGQVRSCRFCEIVRNNDEPFVYEDEHVVVFRPLRPIVPSHVLIVPRAHIRNVNRLAERHRDLLVRMHCVAKTVMTHASESGVMAEGADVDPHELDRIRPDTDTKRVHYSFHVPPFNSIDHVHMHAFLDDPRSLGYYGRLKYRTESWWCRSYDQVVAKLDHLPVLEHQHEPTYHVEDSTKTFTEEGLLA